MRNIVYVGCDNHINITALKRTSDDTIIADAVIQCTMTDLDGVPVAGITWPITLPAVSGSPGDYTGLIPAAAALERNTYYQLHMDATGGGYSHKWVVTVVAAIDTK